MSSRVKGIHDTNISRVIRKYERGADEKSIAKSVEVSAPTISKWLTEAGYKRNGKGRIPLAMKSRIRDLSMRGWSDSKIATLIKMSVAKVSGFSAPKKNPILGGEADPLKVLGVSAEKRKARKKRKRKKRKEISHTSKGAPPMHRCRKHWTPVEEQFVIKLIKNNISPLAIYRRMRASRSRQTKIWNKLIGPGRPPNFPPPKPRCSHKGGSKPPIKPGGGKVEAIDPEPGATTSSFDPSYFSDVEKIKALEAEAGKRAVRIAELERAAEDDIARIEELKLSSKRLALKAEKLEGHLALSAGILERKALPAASVRRRVLPGSYEAEKLGLKVGSLVTPKAPGRRKSKTPGSYADNGRYFTVSKDWADLEDATTDELELFAFYLSSKKLPSKVEDGGDQPRAYTESTFPKKLEAKWVKSVDGGLDLLEKYRDRKAKFRKRKAYSEKVASYLAWAYAAYGDGSVKGEKKAAAKERMMDDWARLKKLDRLILIFKMKAADPTGEPTTMGVERGRIAKSLLHDRAAKRIDAKSKMKSKALEASRRAEAAKETRAMLDAARASIALTGGDSWEGEYENEGPLPLTEGAQHEGDE